jgi:predicted nucleic acid-binding protein
VKQIATFDSSFWINAHRSGLLSHVLASYELRCAPAVAAEMDPAFPSGQEFQQRRNAGLITVVSPTVEQIRDFGAGERATLNLALEYPDWLVLMDDHRPFREAMRLRLTAICTPVLVIALFSGGRIDAEETLRILGELAAIQTVSPHLFAVALAQLGRSARRQGGG